MAGETPPMKAKDFLILEDQELTAQCEVDCYRASGPGGQKRNKTSSAVRLRHRPTGLIAIAEEDRSQHVNRARAVRRLRRLIAMQIRTAVDLEGYEPGEVLRGCISRDAKLSVGQRDERYPHVIAEIMDVLAASELRLSEAAEKIGVSTANLVKLIEKDAKWWDRINELRRDAGMKPLRRSS
jgi:hypothetical protein